MTSKPTEIVDHLFRHEYGKMVASLTKVFGLDHVELAEDVVQESFIRAIKAWRNQIPNHPKAWLYRVAKNQAIDHFRKQKIVQRQLSHPYLDTELSASLEDCFLPHQLQDHQLQLIFAICHPDIKQADQLALGLQLACGFGHNEIGKALFLHPETVRKRLQRAKKKLRESDAKLTVPLGEELTTRRRTALHILYLIFNEGYYANTEEMQIRRDLCAEAMRLTKLFCEHKPTQSSQSYALMALMCYHVSRFESRIGESEQIVLLPDQDRSLWNQDLIQVGHFYMNKINLEEPPNQYLLEAAIAAQHCQAKLYEETNWLILDRLYAQLFQLTQNPMVVLNHAVVLSELGQYRKAITLLHQLDENSLVGSNHLYFAVMAEIKGKLGLWDQCRSYLEQAIQATHNPKERQLYINRLNEI